MTEHGKDRHTILVVDDHKISRELFKNILSEKYEILEASNGLEALEILESHWEIVLVLLDIYMGEMSGFQVLEQIQKDERMSQIPVLMCTGSEEVSDAVQAFDLGAVDCITKPCNAKILMKRVENTIQKVYLEKKSLEGSLKDTSDRLQVMIDTMPGGVAIYKLQDHLIPQYYNDALCELVGMTREEFEFYTNQDAMDIVYTSDRERVWNSILEAVKEKKKIDLTFRVYHKTGEPVWIHLVAKQFREEDSVPIIHAVYFDVSAEKEAELQAEQEVQKFRYLAEHDPLTGINNRKAFCEKTEIMLQNNPDKKYILLCWDVEKFKVINDLFGNEVGNRVLKALAMHFASSMLGIGTYGRLGDDHFAICYPETHCSAEAAWERANSALGVLNINYKITVCMGAYRIEDRSLPVSNMCDRANLALQDIKGNYLRNFAFYDDRLRATMLKEQELCDEMERGLAEKQFQVYIQPKYDLDTRKIIGGEALIRWIHPVRGMISPGEFVPLFERNGAIIRLDAFVWDKTCQYLHQWQSGGMDIVPISVNISRLNFLNRDLTAHFSRLLKKYELTTKYVELEVTESVYADNSDIFYRELERLQSAGFKILMDDFGSGYSSFNMLKEAPVDVLKLDMMFLRGSDKKGRANKIIRAIMNMAELIDMPVVAEGVETEDHVNFLKGINCKAVQGFYFQRPIPAEQFQKLLEEQNQK